MKTARLLQNAVWAVFLLMSVSGLTFASANGRFTVGLQDGEISLNPLTSFTSTEAQIFTGLYEGLLVYDPITLRPVPGVARSLEVSEDGLTYRFFIREDARYSNGEPVRAEHFRETWFAMIEPERASAYSFLFDVIDGVEAYRAGSETDRSTVGIEVIEDTQLEVRLHEQAPHFRQMLPHHSFAVLHPNALEEFRTPGSPTLDETTFIGNGPFAVAESSEQELLLKRNVHYWDTQNVAYDEIQLLLAEDSARQTEMFNEGYIDWIHSGYMLSEVRFRETIVVNPMFSTSYFFFRVADEPWDNALVRRALALLVPWDTIRNEEFHFTPGHTLVPPIPNYPAPEGIQQQDVEAALELLSEAGFPDGEGLPELVLLTPGGGENDRVFQILQDSWQESIGLMVSHEVVPHPRYYDALEANKDYTLGSISWIGDYADPLTFLQLWTASSNLNEAGFSDQEYEALLLQSVQQTGEERYQTMAQAESILLDSAVVLPVNHSPAVNLIDLEFVDGWFPNPLDIHPFKTIRPGERRAAPGVIRYIR
ncbi:MAG: peptide ABC transporter substrate-binding protein [Spirochaeta sp.]|nr:peptide ABC transporter substrate-binding protein [Spirochaeta sp.]